MEKQRKYQFSWEDTIGRNMDQARPSLGENTSIQVYRLFQFTLRDILEQQYGTEMADILFKEAGFLAGKSFFDHFLKDSNDLGTMVNEIQKMFIKLGMGIFRVESADPENGHFIFTVDEDLDCSGLPDTAEEICVYDEGFIKGILDSFTKKNFDVKEIDCWCTGARTCRFEAKNKV